MLTISAAAVTATTTAVGRTVATIGLLLAAGITAVGAVITKRSLRGLLDRAAAAYPPRRRHRD